MIDPQVALQAAVAEAFRDIGLPHAMDDVEDFLGALREHGYVVVRAVDVNGEE